MSYTASLIDKYHCLDIIKPWICLTYYDDDNMYRIEEKMERGAFVHVVNSITDNAITDGIYKEANLGSLFSISEAFDDYIENHLIDNEMQEHEHDNIVDEFIDYGYDVIDYFQLLDDYTDACGKITISSCHDLKYKLNVFLGKEIFRRGFLELSGRFMNALLKAVVCFQKAVRRKIQKRQAKKVLNKTLENFDSSNVSAIVSSFL